MNGNGTPIIREMTHTRHGELMYPTVPYTYECTAAIFAALSTVDALKAVKLVWDKKPLSTMTPEGTRAYAVSSQAVNDLVTANVLEEVNGKYAFTFTFATMPESVMIVDVILGRNDDFGSFSTPKAPRTRVTPPSVLYLRQ